MEETASILTSEANPQSGLHVQRSLYSDSHLNKLIETENKLNQVFEEYTGRIESFIAILDLLKEAVFLKNDAGEVCYANEAGNTLIKDFGGALPEYLSYRSIEGNEAITLHNESLPGVQIHLSNFLWNGERCNLFVVEKHEPVKQEIIFQSASNSSEPLETLMNYLHLIAEHQAHGRINEAAECAVMAGKTLAESEKLIAEAKAYLHLLNCKPAPSQISMQKIGGDVLKSIGPEIEDAEIEVSVSELPEAMGDKELITMLLKHLISNAVKFRNKGRKAIIDIGHDKSEGQFIFCVRDNGIGISKKYHEEVFNLGFRLNDKIEYPGNGMGLAVCKKIVELHSGKIWVESLPGHGSNFYFRLNTRQ